MNFESLLSKARQSNLINSDFALKTIIDEMNTFRGCCGMLQSFDWISIPLVYTQVVTVAVYGFFVSCLFGRQYLIPQNDSQNMTLSVPVPNYEYEVGFISLAPVYGYTDVGDNVKDWSSKTCHQHEMSPTSDTNTDRMKSSKVL